MLDTIAAPIGTHVTHASTGPLIYQVTTLNAAGDRARIWPADVADVRGGHWVDVALLTPARPTATFHPTTATLTVGPAAAPPDSLRLLTCPTLAWADILLESTGWTRAHPWILNPTGSITAELAAAADVLAHRVYATTTAAGTTIHPDAAAQLAALGRDPTAVADTVAPGDLCPTYIPVRPHDALGRIIVGATTADGTVALLRPYRAAQVTWAGGDLYRVADADDDGSEVTTAGPVWAARTPADCDEHIPCGTPATGCDIDGPPVRMYDVVTPAGILTTPSPTHAWSATHALGGTIHTRVIAARPRAAFVPCGDDCMGWCLTGGDPCDSPPETYAEATERLRPYAEAALSG